MGPMQHAGMSASMRAQTKASSVTRVCAPHIFNHSTPFIDGKVQVHLYILDDDHSLIEARMSVSEPTKTHDIWNNPVHRHQAGDLMDSKYAAAPGSVAEKREWLLEDINRHNLDSERKAYEHRRKLDMEQHMKTAQKFLDIAQTAKHPFEIYRNIGRITLFFPKPVEGQPGYLPKGIEDECTKEFEERTRQMMQFRFTHPKEKYDHLDPSRAPIETMKFENLPDEVPGAVYKSIPALSAEAKAFVPTKRVLLSTEGSSTSAELAAPKKSPDHLPTIQAAPVKKSPALLDPKEWFPKALDTLAKKTTAISTSSSKPNVAPEAMVEPPKPADFALDGPSSEKNFKTEVSATTSKTSGASGRHLVGQDEFLASFFATQNSKNKQNVQRTSSPMKTKPSDQMSESHPTTSRYSMSERSMTPSSTTNDSRGGRLADPKDFLAAIQQKSGPIKKSVAPNLPASSSNLKASMTMELSEVKPAEVKPAAVVPMKVVKSIDAATQDADNMALDSTENNHMVSQVAHTPSVASCSSTSTVKALAPINRVANTRLANDFFAWMSESKPKSSLPAVARNVKSVSSPEHTDKSVTEKASVSSSMSAMAEEQTNELQTPKSTHSPQKVEPMMPITPATSTSAEQSVLAINASPEIPAPATPVSIAKEKTSPLPTPVSIVKETTSNSLASAANFAAWLAKAKPMQKKYVAPSYSRRDIFSRPESTIQEYPSAVPCNNEGKEASESHASTEIVRSSSSSADSSLDSDENLEDPANRVLLWNGVPLGGSEDKQAVDVKVALWDRPSGKFTVDMKNPKFLEGHAVELQKFIEKQDTTDTKPNYKKGINSERQKTQTSSLEVFLWAQARKAQALKYTWE